MMVDAVNKNGGTAELTVIENMGHNDGIDYIYRNTDIVENILRQRRSDFSYVPDVCEECF